MLYVVNFRGKQVHSSVSPAGVAGYWLAFSDGTAAKVDTEVSVESGTVRFVREDDSDYMSPDAQITDEIVIVDVTDEGALWWPDRLTRRSFRRPTASTR